MNSIQSWMNNGDIIMKSVLIALLLVAVVLFVGAEARGRGGKGKPGGRRPGGKHGGRPGGKPWHKKEDLECPRNCSECQEGVCHACDEDFALITRRFKKTKTICVPCGRRLKWKNPDLYHDQCAKCPRNCSDCQEGVCYACDEDFVLTNITTRQGFNKTICMRVSECPRNCSDCQEGVCYACDEKFALKTNTFGRFNKTKTICVPCGPRLRLKYPDLFLDKCVTECPRNCLSCEGSNCKTCDAGFFSVKARLLQRTICVPCGPRMRKYWPDVHAKNCPQKGKGKRKTPSV